jgi:hypothetical protein
MLRRVARVRTDVSEELSSSFIRGTRIGELGTLAVISNRRTLLSNDSKENEAAAIVRQNFANCNSEMVFSGRSTEQQGTTTEERSQVLRDLDLRATALTRLSSTCTSRLQTRPLVREDAPYQEIRKYLLTIFVEEKENLVSGPRLRPDTRTD